MANEMYEMGEEVIIVALLCEEAENQREEKDAVYIGPNSRYEEGEYHTLFPRLLRDPDRCRTHFRMAKGRF